MDIQTQLSNFLKAVDQGVSWWGDSLRFSHRPEMQERSQNNFDCVRNGGGGEKSVMLGNFMQSLHNKSEPAHSEEEIVKFEATLKNLIIGRAIETLEGQARFSKTQGYNILEAGDLAILSNAAEPMDAEVMDALLKKYSSGHQGCAVSVIINPEDRTIKSFSMNLKTDHSPEGFISAAAQEAFGQGMSQYAGLPRQTYMQISSTGEVSIMDPSTSWQWEILTSSDVGKDLTAESNPNLG